MQIYIPSLHRMEQPSWSALPLKWKKRTTVVCHHDDVKPLKARYPGMQVHPRPTGVHGIGNVRQWILEKCPASRMVMLDDDLRFAYRTTGVKLAAADSHQVSLMMDKMDEYLKEYAHGSVSAREGNNRVEKPITFIGRSLRVLGYNVDMIRGKVQFNRLPCKVDFDMTLQLLRLGFQNFILWDWANDQVSGSNASGGCSLYRTPEVLAKAAHDLAALHPGFVKVVEKESKHGWKGMGNKRTDVVVYWKKAFTDSYQGLL